MKWHTYEKGEIDYNVTKHSENTTRFRFLIVSDDFRGNKYIIGKPNANLVIFLKY